MYISFKYGSRHLLIPKDHGDVPLSIGAVSVVAVKANAGVTVTTAKAADLHLQAQWQ